VNYCQSSFSGDFVTRSVTVSAGISTTNEKSRTIRTVLVTESPVTIIDLEGRNEIDEILLIEGAEIPDSKQVPLFDNHKRSGTQSIRGSVRNILINRNELMGTLHFSSLASDLWTLVKEQHITDVSAGYQVFKSDSVYIERKKAKVINGQMYRNDGERTLVIRTRWKLKEISLTPIGNERFPF